MRSLLCLLTCLLLLGGCASKPKDPSGTWINQAAIDAAVESQHLREALLAYGPNLEWNLNSARQQATFSNGFELAEGQLSAQADGSWQVNFNAENNEALKPQADLLIQQASAIWPEQRFARPKVKVDAAAFAAVANSAVVSADGVEKARIATGDDAVDPVAQAKAIVNELKKYDKALYDKPRWLVLNKLDMVPLDERAARVADFVKRFKWKGPVFEISALTREGCEPLIHAIYRHVKAQQVAEQAPVEEVDPRFAGGDPA